MKLIGFFVVYKYYEAAWLLLVLKWNFAESVPNFNDINVGGSKMIIPGGKSRCILGSPFKFQVHRQDNDKLLIYFQGGGVCYDKLSTLEKHCPIYASHISLEGMLSRNTSLYQGKFSRFTVIRVTYCSGDLHLGRKVQPYKGPNGKVVDQRGLDNFETVLSWIETQQTNGGIAKVLTELVVLGTSAGTYPAMLLTHIIAARLNYRRAATFLDSAILVFPPHSTRRLFGSFNLCESFKSMVSPDALQHCKQNDFALGDFFLELALRTPDIPFAFTVAKTDHAQRSFYNNLLQSSTDINQTRITRDQEVLSQNTILAQYAHRLPNVLFYFVNGEEHVYTNRPHYYTADAIGVLGNSSVFKGPTYRQWIESMPLKPNEVIRSVCLGPIRDDIRPVTVATSDVTTVDSVDEELHYCLRDLASKSYVQIPHIPNISLSQNKSGS